MAGMSTGQSVINAQLRKEQSIAFAQLMVAYLFDTPIEELRAPTRRCRRAALVRQMAMYLTHVAYGWNLTEVGQAFGRDRTTASHACHRIEDLRDDPAIDRQLTEIESLLRQARQIGGQTCL